MRESRLRDPAHRVSPKARVLWTASALVQVLVGAGVLFLVSDLWNWFPVPAWAWIGYAVAAIAYLVAMPAIRYQVHRWEVSESAVYTQTGWLTRERRIAPMSRVQTVDFNQGPIGRLVGLASVTVTTASAAGPLQIHGLDRRLAEQLVDDLTRRTGAEAGDAT
ncbi:MAG: PH domain-containing protein [Actinomycetota bacterium]|nr:PH domain-containing protein [Actinomycetota bacterium]